MFYLQYTDTEFFFLITVSLIVFYIEKNWNYVFFCLIYSLILWYSQMKEISYVCKSSTHFNTILDGQ